MKIIRKKKLRLSQFIDYVWEKNLPPFKYLADGDKDSDDRCLVFLPSGVLRMEGGFRDSDTFTVNVEEEVTFTTSLDRVIEVTITGEVMEHHNKSVAAIREEHAPNTLYVPMNGELHLLWKYGMGCLADGVLEVPE